MSTLGCEISVEEQNVLKGVTVCDNCYLEKSNPVKAYNPLAVYSAKRFMEPGGPEAVARLTEQQRAIYEFIRSRGKVTQEELVKKFNLSRIKITNQFAVLRHLELTEGKEEGNKTYIVPF